jgi:hypothetical protein
MSGIRTGEDVRRHYAKSQHRLQRDLRRMHDPRWQWLVYAPINLVTIAVSYALKFALVVGVIAILWWLAAGL